MNSSWLGCAQWKSRTKMTKRSRSSPVGDDTAAPAQTQVSGELMLPNYHKWHSVSELPPRSPTPGVPGSSGGPDKPQATFIEKSCLAACGGACTHAHTLPSHDPVLHYSFFSLFLSPSRIPHWSVCWAAFHRVLLFLGYMGVICARCNIQRLINWPPPYSCFLGQTFSLLKEVSQSMRLRLSI